MEQGSALCVMQAQPTPLQLTFSAGRERAPSTDTAKKTTAAFLWALTPALDTDPRGQAPPGTFCEGCAQAELGTHEAQRARAKPHTHGSTYTFPRALRLTFMQINTHYAQRMHEMATLFTV